MVEAFTEDDVRGWVSVTADSPPTEVELRLGSMTVSTTTATPDGAMSASRKSASPTPSLPPPKGDRRHSRQQIRTFTFAISQLWEYAPQGTPLRVVTGSQVLP